MNGTSVSNENSSNVIRVGLPHDESYHNLTDAGGAVIARRFMLTRKAKEDTNTIGTLLAEYGFLEEDRYVVLGPHEDGAYDVIDPEHDGIAMRIVPATQMC